MLYCFLDTNIFIHCQDIKDIDWQSELGAPEICLVIAPVVFEELDVFKDDPRNNRKRNRARNAIKLLETTLDSTDQAVREGVSLEYAAELYHMKFSSYNLNPSNKDDRLVASAIGWSQEHVDAELILVSHDSGPRMKAKQRGLRAKELSGKYRLPDQLDPLAKENRELQNELRRRQDTQPKLEIGFLAADKSISRIKHVSIQFVEDLINEDGIEAAISEEFNQSKYTRKTYKYDPMNPRNIEVPDLLVTNSDISEYHSELNDWLRSDYRNYLIEQSLYRVFQNQSVEFALAIRNTGTIPAENVIMSMKIHNIRKVIEFVPSGPHRPVESKPKLQMRSSLAVALGRTQEYFNWGGSPPKPISLQIDKLGTKQLELYCDYLMHYKMHELESRYLIIDRPATFPAAIEIEYEAIAANLIDKVTDKLKIIITNKTE